MGGLMEVMGAWLAGERVPDRATLLERFPHLKPLDFRDLGARLDRDLNSYGERMTFVRRYGFAIPCQEALDALTGLDPLLEVGAGTGAWARLLLNRGVDLIATDPATDYGHLFKHASWLDQMEVIDAVTAVQQWPERHVFCSWPSLDEIWLKDAAALMQPGRTLAVIREEATANEETWAYIEDAFAPVRTVAIPQWFGLHDRLELWRKR